MTILVISHTLKSMGGFSRYFSFAKLEITKLQIPQPSSIHPENYYTVYKVYMLGCFADSL